MKIGIDMGHTLSGIGTGAVGHGNESKLTREVGILVIEKLKKLGYQVVNCTVDKSNSVIESLKQIVYKANSSNLDLFVSIHFNSGGGEGAEVFTYKGKSFPQAVSVLNNIVKLGYKNRGIKNGSKLYVIRKTKSKSMLIECAFVDSHKDMKLFNAQKMASAIVKGIIMKNVDIPNSDGSSQKPSLSLDMKNLIKQLQHQLNVQFNSNLIEDGIIGPLTKKALILVRKGAQGEITKIIQKLLNAKGYLSSKGIDGIFGIETENAIKKLQKDKGLLIDGIVGKNTWNELLR